MTNSRMVTSPGKMIVYVWEDGSWCFGWDSVAKTALSRLNGPAKRVDLDKHLEMDLSPLEIQACIGAIDECEASRSR